MVSQDDQARRARTANGIERNRAVEGDEPASLRGRERKEVDIRNLARSVEMRAIDRFVVEQTHVAGPVRVMPAPRRRSQQIGRLGGGDPIRITRLTHHAHHSVLRDGAGSPSVSNLALEPGASQIVMDVVAVEQRHHDVDVEQRSEAPQGQSSSSSNRSIKSLETVPPLRGNGRKP